jgi:hypothetical protein
MLCAVLPPMGAVAHEQEESMKRSKLMSLIARLENEVDDDHFWMGAWLAPSKRRDDYQFIHYQSEESIPHCQTAGCIAGTVFLGLTPEQRKEYITRFGEHGLVEKVAIHELDLTYLQGIVMFEPGAMSSITRQHAIDMLKHLNATGFIDWPRVLPEALHNMLVYYAERPMQIIIDDDPTGALTPDGTKLGQ